MPKAESTTSGRDPKETSIPLDEELRIGSSSYYFSEEAQGYLRREYSITHGHSQCLVVTNEPHHSVESQFNLYKGLELLFQDNPELVEKTAFLAEGFPAHQPVSIQSLIDADPNPNEGLIREVLSTFLITGYMAYEWKHQTGIPIIGTEDEELYRLSREYQLLTAQEPNFPFAIIPLKNGSLFEVKPIVPWGYTVAARNKTIAQTLIESASIYENPMLFVGKLHIGIQKKDEFDLISALVHRGTVPFPWIPLLGRLECKNLGIYDYLRERGFGFTFLNPLSLDAGMANAGSDWDAYLKLFRTQELADIQNSANNPKYLEWLLSQKGSSGGITVRPSPEAAAEFVRRLKGKQQPEQENRVIYEAKEERNYPHWYKTSRDEESEKIREKYGVDSIWELGPSPRGKAYELMRGAYPASNLEHVDDIRLDARTITGMKSIELRDPTYQDIKGLDRRVRECIDELIGYPGGIWKKERFDRGKDFDDVYLEIGIPADTATSGQVDKLLELQEYARSVGMTLVINEVP